ncbi:MAG: SusD/RagB family nutrient-binding outer membrane lipoprotein [Bacteroidota bacterium]
MKKLIYIAVLTLMVAACEQDFEEINTNLNEPESVTGAFLLPTVIFDIAEESVTNSKTLGDIVMQYAANYEFNDTDIYNWGGSGQLWDFYATLQDVQDIETYGVEVGLPNYEAIGLILKSYIFSLLNDAYGDVPYSQANQATAGNFTPAYDAQQDIYTGIFADLERANGLLTDGPIDGDILFGGDPLLWQKLANSLHVRLLMRTAGVQDVSSELSKIVNDPATYPLMVSNADNAIYDFSGALPDISPISAGRGRAYEYYLSIPTTHLVNTLVELQDPRLEEWLNLNELPDYLGVAPGQTLGDVGRPDAFSQRNPKYFDESGLVDGILMTFSELNFILAEAIEQGYLEGDAKTYYETAVQASFDQWNVPMPANYLTETAAYEAGNLEQIAVQKWLSLWQNSMEAWFDWKRTGRPTFIQAGPGNVNGDRVPVRLMYPGIEQSVNADNYNAALGRMGADNINTRVWWDQ